MPDDDEDLRTRMQVVEHELGRARAAGADCDVSEVRAELRRHTCALNALRETQVEHGNAILELRAEMRGGFATLTTGMEHITTLLDRVIERGE